MVSNSQYIKIVNSGNKDVLEKPVNVNIIYFSTLQEIYIQNVFRNFSVKYCVEGTMRYQIGSKKIEVPKGHFFFANKQPNCFGFSYQNDTIKSLCIDINPTMANEAFTLLKKGQPDFDNLLCGEFMQANFLENIYYAKHYAAGYTIQKLVHYLVNDPEEIKELNEEWFFGLTEHVILHETSIKQSLNNLRKVKLSTREETLKRLLKGREYANDTSLTNPSIKEIARHCMMSEFHFFRSFRNAFGQTPYNYLLERRLNHAKTLLAGKNKPLTEIASLCGFADLFTFSKAFKRKFGTAPSFYQHGLPEL
ncbi:MAG: helix-turn-helix domain-containing protein [Chitinophagaceae bacterium]